MEIHEQVKKSLEELKEGCNSDNISDPPSDTDWLEKHLITSQVALLESVIKSLDGIMFEDRNEAGQFGLWVDGYNASLEDQITYLKEQINKIKEL